MSTGTIVYATIIDAPSSTKNKDKALGPEMHQTKKGNQWYFGIKGHIGIDSESKLIHSVAATAANVHDSQLIGELLHGNETRVWGDSAYTGQGDRIRGHAPNAKDFTHQKGKHRYPLSDEEKAWNKSKSKVRKWSARGRSSQPMWEGWNGSLLPLRERLSRSSCSIPMA